MKMAACKRYTYTPLYRDFLPTLFGVSSVDLVAADTPQMYAEGATELQSRRVTVSRAEGGKCERCWRVVPAVSQDPETEGLCPRCVDALAPAAHA